MDSASPAAPEQRYFVIVEAAPSEPGALEEALSRVLHLDDAFARARGLTLLPRIGAASLALFPHEVEAIRKVGLKVAQVPRLRIIRGRRAAPPPPGVRFWSALMAWLGWPEPIRQIGAHLVWPCTRGGGIRVAVLDTGIAEHPQLQDAVASWQSFVKVGGVYESPYLIDDDHGTLMAGIIGARPADGSPVVGVAPACTLVSVKVARTNEVMGDWLADGLLWCAENNIEVVSMSLALDGQEGRKPDVVALLEAALAAVRDAGGVMLAAVDDGPGPVSWPACSQKVIGVGSVDGCGKRTLESCYGPGVDELGVEVMAPGGAGISSTSGSGGVDTIANTSAAGAHAAGVAALVRARNPTFDPGAVRRRLRETATDIEDPGVDVETGWGVVNAPRAVFGSTFGWIVCALRHLPSWLASHAPFGQRPPIA